MKNNLSSILLILFAFYACNTSQNESNVKEAENVVENTESVSIPKLFITTFTVIDTGIKQKIDTVTTVMNTDYFEIGLCSLVDKTKAFNAKKDIENATSFENYRYIFLRITDEQGEDIYFKGSTEFLNFMSEHGYEMVDQEKHKYRTDYTFKKKS